jgi:T5SS/PEP-CTERM-associated repeat protein
MPSHHHVNCIADHHRVSGNGSPIMRRITRFIFTPVFFALVVGVAARADDYYWTNPGDGDFDDPANWNDGAGGVPGENDVAIVDTGGSHSISFWSDPATDRALFRSAFVSLNAYGPEAPYTYTLLNPLGSTPGFVVGHGGRDLAWLRLGKVHVHAVNATVGHLADATGTLTLYASAALFVNEHLITANEGLGTLETFDGATITCGTATIGLAASAIGEATLKGAETLWTCNGPLTVGKSGAGVLTINEAATLTCHDAVIGQIEDSTGAVTVTDGATWTIDGTLDVGMTGFGSLLIEDGGSVANHTFATIGTYDSWPFGNGGVGEVTVDADYDDASWVIDGDLYIGFFGEGTLSILGDGYHEASVNVSGDASIGLNIAGTLILSHGGRITIGGNFSNYDHTFDRLVIELANHNDYLTPAIEVSGVISAFDPEVILNDNYEPQAGDTFTVAHADIGLYDFSFTLPELPEDLQWQVVQDNHDVSLLVLSAIEGDINNDGVVNTADLLLLLAAWGDCPGCPEDLNDDGVVNTTDLLTLLANWG